MWLLPEGAARAIRTAGASLADRAGEVNSGQAKVSPTPSKGELSTARAKPLHGQANWLFHFIMDAERIEQAVQRIEAALARIGAVADAPALAPVTDTVPGETEAHLRQTVADTLAELDQLIGKLDT